jgi:hypothetical protein
MMPADSWIVGVLVAVRLGGLVGEGSACAAARSGAMPDKRFGFIWCRVVIADLCSDVLVVLRRFGIVARQSVCLCCCSIR